MIIRKKDTAAVGLLAVLALALWFFIPKVRATSTIDRTADVSCLEGVTESCSFSIPFGSMTHAELVNASACRDLNQNVHVVYTVADVETGGTSYTPEERTFVGSNDLNFPLSMARYVRFLDVGADGHAVQFGKSIPIDPCEK